MSYKKLHSHFAASALHIPRNEVKAKVMELAGLNRLRIVVSGLDTSVCRGMYLTPQNHDHPIVQQFGCHLIVVARDLNRCWQRFIIVKELMHLLDGVDSATDSGETFDKVVSEIGGGVPDRSRATDAEIIAFWKALAILCPERARQTLLEDKAKGHITDYGIALRLKIPELYVRHLYSPHYPVILRDLY